MNRRITLDTPVVIPDAPELHLLRTLLAASQRHWLAFFSGHFNSEPAPLDPVTLHWSGPLYGTGSHSVHLFAAQRLFRSGWLDSLHMDQRGLRATLPLLVPLLPEASATVPTAPAELHPTAQAFHRLLEAHQQQLLACIAGDFGNRIECVRALRVGDDADVPLALAQVLQAGGLAQCYTAVASREAYGADSAPVDGAAITLRVQDATLAHGLVQRLKAS